MAEARVGSHIKTTSYGLNNFTCSAVVYASEKSYSIANNTSVVTVTYSAAITYNLTFSGTSRPNAGTLRLVVNGVTHDVAMPFNSGMHYGSIICQGSYTQTVNHNTDGSKSIGISIQILEGTDPQNYGVVWVTSTTATDTLTLTTIPRASKPTYSTNPLTIGQTQTITTNRASSGFTHTLALSFGDYNETLTEVGESTTWTASSSLMEYMTSWQMPVTVICTTYNGSIQIGTSSTSFTLQVDTSVYKPVITVGTLTDANASTAGLTNNTFIRNKSLLSVPISISANNTDYGDYVASSTATLGSTSDTHTGSTTGMAYIFQATTTTNELVITATDNRGYTVTQTVTITLLEYSNIVIQSVEYARVNANNVETETGEHVRYTIKANAFLGSFGSVTNSITVSSRSKLASAQVYDQAVTEETVTTSGTGMGEITITGVSVGTYSPSSQFDVVYILSDALSSATAQSIRVHEGVPVAAWGEDHFDIYGEFHVHDREDVTKYITIYPNGYRWNLLGTATASNAVALDLTNYCEVMLILEYAENATYTWATSTTIPVAELSTNYLYCMMPARIAPTAASDFGGVVRIKLDSANAFEFVANRASQTPTLKVYAR